MNLRYITMPNYKRDLIIRLAKERRMLDIVPSERHKLECLKLIEEIETELEGLN